MKFIGAHVSTEGGVENAPVNAGAIGARAFALFAKPQRQWKCPPLKAGVADAFRANCEASGIPLDKVLPHASYLINMAAPDDDARARAVDSLVSELTRCAELGLVGLNIHPGSYVGKGTPAEGLARIADSVNKALAATDGVKVILENTAGQGSYLGSKFGELADIIAMVDDKARVGVCLDTAHMYGAGYDITTDEGFAAMADEFESLVGLGRLCGMHLNDTAVKCESHLDRHQPIGDGVLGWNTFGRIVRDERFDDIPLILETPDPSRWADEIRRLYEL